MQHLNFGNDDFIQARNEVKPKLIKYKKSVSHCLYYICGACFMTEKCTAKYKYIDSDGVPRCKVDGDSRIGLILK